MPVQKITFRPGISTQLTRTLNEGGWSDCSLVRFRDGLPQPIGGWAKTSPTQFSGIGRKLHSWLTLAGAKLLALGTSARLYVTQADTIYDVTPIQTITTLSSPFSVDAGSVIVTVAAAAHNCAVGDMVNFSGASAVGGLTIAGDYSVTAVVDANTFVITAATPAISTATDGGTVTASFYLHAGLTNASILSGWGAGAWDAGSWGTSRAGLSNAGALRLWSIDHWGEEMVAAPRDGAVYNWKPANGFNVRAAVISQAPLYNKALLTGMPERHLIAFGAEAGGVQDPLLVRWSDVEDYTTWTATATNSAGSYRIVGGSQIMAAAGAQGEILIWTDTTLWAMRFQNLPYVYGFFQQGAVCGVISPNAATVMNGVAYWMGTAGFFRYAGQVQPMPCSVRDAVFRNLNQGQSAKVHCAPNFGFNEVSWFYPSINSAEPDRYVTLNVVDNTWTMGALSRTAWEDATVLANPVAAGADSYLYTHEFGASADGVPLGEYLESGYFDLGDGQVFMFVDELIPDFADQGGTVLLTLKGQAYPNGAQRVRGPYSAQPRTERITSRMRARQIALRLESTGGFWRLGALRVRLAPDGRK